MAMQYLKKLKTKMKKLRSSDYAKYKGTIYNGCFIIYPQCYLCGKIS